MKTFFACMYGIYKYSNSNIFSHASRIMLTLHMQLSRDITNKVIQKGGAYMIVSRLLVFLSVCHCTVRTWRSIASELTDNKWYCWGMIIWTLFIWAIYLCLSSPEVHVPCLGEGQYFYCIQFLSIIWMNKWHNNNNNNIPSEWAFQPRAQITPLLLSLSQRTVTSHRYMILKYNQINATIINS